MHHVTYNVPAALVETVRGQRLVVRSHDSTELQDALVALHPDDLLYLQLLLPTTTIDDLMQWGEGVPIDIVMSNPEADFPQLYHFAELLEKHPVRVSIPVVPGFSKAVKLAVALNLAVKLEVAQPEPALVEEMSQVLDYYLHHATVMQPIDFFHSTLLAFYHQEPTTLWMVQEEDPNFFRHITEQGAETVAKRLAGAALRCDRNSIDKSFSYGLFAEAQECGQCEFREHCVGYFKWPYKAYSCDGIKTLFRTLQNAAGELRQDLGAYLRAKSEQVP
jgi:hypothetical protein